MRKFIYIILSIMLLANVSIAFAVSNNIDIERTQTVYSVVDWTGQVTSTSVVNWLRINTQGDIKIDDNPELADIVSLHPTASLSAENDSHSWSIKADGETDLFYTGKTDKSLPVDISIETNLNGKSVGIEDIQGASGELSIDFTFTNTLAHEETISWTVGDKTTERLETIYTPMTIMLQADISSDDFDKLEQTGAFEMTIGNSRKFMWSLLPRPTETVHLSITDDNLTLPAISISIIPQAPSFPIPEIDTTMFELMGSMGDTSELMEMMEGAESLDMSSALENIENLEGMTGAIESMANEQSEGMESAVMFFDGLNKSLSGMRDGAENLISLSEGHKMILTTIKSELAKSSEGITASSNALTDAKSATNDVSKSIFAIKFYLEDISSQLDDLKDLTDDEDMLATISELDGMVTKSLSKVEVIKGDADEAERLIAILSDGGTLDGVEVPAMSDTPEMIGMLDDSLSALISGGEIQGQEMPGLTTTIEGLGGIASGAGLMLDGGEMEGKTVPPLSEVSGMITDSAGGLDVFAKGGEINGVTIPSQDELKSMIDDFKATIEQTAPMQEKMDELSSKFKKAIDEIGGAEALEGATEDIEELLMGETAKFDRMNELADEYTSFVGDTPDADSSVLFVLKLNTPNHTDSASSNDNAPIDTDDTNPYKDISRARLYLLIIASVIIIIAIVINWFYKRKHSE